MSKYLFRLLVSIFLVRNVIRCIVDSSDWFNLMTSCNNNNNDNNIIVMLSYIIVVQQLYFFKKNYHSTRNLRCPLPTPVHPLWLTSPQLSALFKDLIKILHSFP